MSIPNISNNLTVTDLKIKGDTVFMNPKNLGGNPGILLAHAEWCGHCKRFSPIFQKMSKKLNSGKNGFSCLAIESEELNKNSKLSKVLEIEGFPTLYWVDQHGKILGKHEGGRDEGTLLNEICSVYHHCISKH